MIHSDELHDLINAADQEADDLSAVDRLMALCLTVMQQSRTMVRNTIDRGAAMDKPAVSDTQITFGPGHFVALPPSRRRRKLLLPYMYWCAVCNEVVMTKKSEQELDRCTKCGSPRWRGSHVRDRRHADWSRTTT